MKRTAEERIVTLSRYENENPALVLKEEDIPAVGNKPAEHYKEGSWDTEPGTETEITDWSSVIVKKSCPESPSAR